MLVPTRELAVQVRDECVKLAFGRDVHVVGVYGGKPIRQQVEHLRRGAEIIVGTPGRVIDLIGRGSLLLGGIRFVVLDEADRMLDIGFRPDIEKILRRCPQSRQTLLLSATIPPPVKRLAERYMREPEMVDFSTKDLAVETIEQWYFTVDPERKFDLLVKLVRAGGAAAGDRLLPHQAGDRQGLPAAGPGSQGRRHDPRRLAAIGPRPRDAPLPRGQDRRCWWPPTWWAGAST